MIKSKLFDFNTFINLFLFAAFTIATIAWHKSEVKIKELRTWIECIEFEAQSIMDEIPK